jgi:hypothetical protein
MKIPALQGDCNENSRKQKWSLPHNCELLSYLASACLWRVQKQNLQRTSAELGIVIEFKGDFRNRHSSGRNSRPADLSTTIYRLTDSVKHNISRTSTDRGTHINFIQSNRDASSNVSESRLCQDAKYKLPRSTTDNEMRLSFTELLRKQDSPKLVSRAPD